MTSGKPAFDRAAIMRDAHRRYRRRRGTAEPLAFGECLRRAWAAARQRSDRGRRIQAPWLAPAAHALEPPAIKLGGEFDNAARL